MGPSKIKKRSIIVNGHKTSVSLEDEFWDELRGLAAERRVPLTELVNEIDQVPGRNLSRSACFCSCERKAARGRRKVP
jgi:predicted DNA-binding ribbon-helix-helix protein